MFPGDCERLSLAATKAANNDLLSYSVSSTTDMEEAAIEVVATEQYVFVIIFINRGMRRR